MATIQQFEDLEVWQDARDVVKEVYRMTKQSIFKQDFGLRDQITRAAISTMSNIAEGFERGTRKEFIQFLNVAKGSNAEVRSQLYVALDQNYIDQGAFERMIESVRTLSRRLAKFICYLEKYPDNPRRRRTVAAPVI